MQRFSINSTLRAAHFIAQIAHESGSFVYVKEIASGAAYDTGRLAVKLGNTPASDGDGQKYKGRGYIQLTGRSNYEMFDKFTGGKYNLINHPERIEEPGLAMLVAGWYWNKKNLNYLADKDDIDGITHIINGGANGLLERKAFLLRAKKNLL
jgi:Predicted chitinase